MNSKCEDLSATIPSLRKASEEVPPDVPPTAVLAALAALAGMLAGCVSCGGGHWRNIAGGHCALVAVAVAVGL